jgi:hypothetical protein
VGDLKYVNIKSRKPIAQIVVVNVYVRMEDVGDYVRIVRGPEFVSIRNEERCVRNAGDLNAVKVQDVRRVEIENMICIVCFVRCISDQISKLLETIKQRNEQLLVLLPRTFLISRGSSIKKWRMGAPKGDQIVLQILVSFC